MLVRDAHDRQPEESRRGVGGSLRRDNTCNREQTEQAEL
jgi:hypothetical protein